MAESLSHQSPRLRLRLQGIPQAHEAGYKGRNVVNGKSEFPFPFLIPVEVLSILALVPCSSSAIGFDFGFANGLTRAVQNTAAYRGATPDKKAVNLMTPIAFLHQQINRDNVTRNCTFGLHLHASHRSSTAFRFAMYCMYSTVQYSR